MTCQSRLPNLFIVGAPKAGTTSLYRYLSAHPDIFFCPIKEPNHFCTDIYRNEFSKNYLASLEFDADTYFDQQNLKELPIAFIQERARYLQLFQGASKETVIAEGSTSYLFSTEAADNIARFDSDAKIIAVLRNPIERAYSHYLMAVRLGLTTTDFRVSIENELSRNQHFFGSGSLYIEFGKYYAQLMRYFQCFPKSQLKIILFEELAENMDETMKRCFAFLDLPPIAIDKRIFNAGISPRLGHIHNLAIKSGAFQKIKSLLPSGLKETLRPLYFRKGKQEEMNPAEKALLQSVFTKDVEMTGDLIGKDLSGWLQ